MLIKTIQLETDDEKLFSKSAPLLAAAAECAYYTVKCSGTSKNSKLFLNLFANLIIICIEVRKY